MLLLSLLSLAVALDRMSAIGAYLFPLARALIGFRAPSRRFTFLTPVDPAATTTRCRIGVETIEAVYGVPEDQLRVFVHYMPQFFHFHVHFTR